MQLFKEGRKKVFVSYSHSDGEWLKRLQIHLKDLERRGLIELWDDTKIQPGAQWQREISDALNSARVAVLLVSADFIASDFIAENELPPLLAAAEKDGVTIVPLILSPSRFEKIESLARFQSINSPSKPLIGLPKVEHQEYLVKLSDAVFNAMEESAAGLVETGQEESPWIFNLSISRNKHFTGREEILNRLHTSFNGGETALALGGIGGVGKTQTALEYAYRHRQDYNVVLWAKAHTHEALVADFAAMAGLLNLREKDAEDQSLAVNAVKKWLGNHSGWLLILDNADEFAMAREFIPSSGTGHVLLTTRAQNTGKIAARIAIEKMEPQEGTIFLLRRLKKINEGEPLEAAPIELRAQAGALSRIVDGLPLALDQAAAYIEETPSTLGEYLHLYQSGRAELLAIRGDLPDDHRDSVAITFSLAFKKVAEANQAAAELLRLCAFLEADAIPEEIFREGAEELGEVLGSVANSPLNLIEAIKEAGRFSLLKRHPEARTVSLHRLVQAVLRDEMGNDTRRMWAERTVRAVNRAFPHVGYSASPLCGRLILHAQLLASLIDEYSLDFPEAGRLMNEAGYYLKVRAQYVEAESLLKQALAISEKALGTERPDVAMVLGNLAEVYSDLGKYAEAEPLYLRALAISERAFGAESPDVASSLNDLVALYHYQGKYVEVESLCQRALTINEKALGSEHPDVAYSLSNLAEVYRTQGKYEEAEPLLKRALAIYEKALGAEHPNVSYILEKLACLYHNQDKYMEAEQFYQQALAIREKALGAEHLYVAYVLNKLAALYRDQGRYAEAEPLYQRALTISEKLLGVEHPNVATVLENYASLLRKMGKDAEAEELQAGASIVLRSAKL